jgi:hypothetical protein
MGKKKKKKKKKKKNTHVAHTRTSHTHAHTHTHTHTSHTHTNYHDNMRRNTPNKPLRWSHPSSEESSTELVMEQDDAWDLFQPGGIPLFNQRASARQLTTAG